MSRECVERFREGQERFLRRSGKCPKRVRRGSGEKKKKGLESVKRGSRKSFARTETEGRESREEQERVQRYSRKVRRGLVKGPDWVQR